MLEWIASASNDMVADSVIAILMGIDQSPASVKCTILRALLNMSLINIDLRNSDRQWS